MTDQALEVRKVKSPAEVALELVTKGVTVEQLKGILDLQKDFEANEARKAFNQAMSEFKKTPLVISKDKKVSYELSTGGKTEYHHATLANVVEKISAELSKHNLSASWRTEQKENGQVSVTCRISHAMGHFEETALSAGMDDSGKKNKIQQLGSTVTYLQRYTLLAITGLASKDQDDDGVATTAAELIDEKQVSALLDHLAARAPEDTDKFLKYMGVKAVEDIPKSKYAKAINVFKTAEKKTNDASKK